MMLRSAWWSLVLVALSAEGALAQRPAATVQLPTYSFFSASTTVSVPDRGGAYLGGIQRAASGRNEFGTPLLPLRSFRNNAGGGTRGASNVYISATIHDMDAMDQDLLSRPTAGRTAQALPGQAAGQGRPLRPRTPGAGDNWHLSAPASTARQPAPSLAELQAERARLQATRVEEALRFFQRGQQAEAQGKPGVAKIYYQMAAQRSSGAFQGQVRSKLELLSAGAPEAKVARRPAN